MTEKSPIEPTKVKEIITIQEKEPIKQEPDCKSPTPKRERTSFDESKETEEYKALTTKEKYDENIQRMKKVAEKAYGLESPEAVDREKAAQNVELIEKGKDMWAMRTRQLLRKRASLQDLKKTEKKFDKLDKVEDGSESE